MKRFVWAIGLILALRSGLRANELIAAGQPLALVIKEKVQKELKLTDEQITAIKKIYDDASKEEKTAALKRLARQLKPEQTKRLQEISYQVRGGSVLADPGMVKKLGLSLTQARKMSEHWKNKEEDLRQILRITRFRNAAAKRKFILENRKDAGKKLLEFLTDEQAASLKKLQGKPFDLSGLDT
jgi:hypothetical protein